MRRPQQRNPRLTQELGRQVAERRKVIGLTQSALAERIGVEAETISRLECGTVLPSLWTLNQIAEELRTGIGELLGAASLQPSDHRGQIEQMMVGLNDDERLFLIDLMQRCVTFIRAQRS